jgi:hypothetical protein
MQEKFIHNFDYLSTINLKKYINAYLSSVYNRLLSIEFVDNFR